MARKLILAEKPAVARDLARVLGVVARGDGSFQDDRYVITWCIGHLVELAEPAEYNPAWRRWTLPALPMLPERFQLRPSAATARQWRVVRELLQKREFAAVINACDAGREGELIFRYCYELAGCRLPIERLWISSLTEQAIAQGFQRLRPGRELEALAAAARCRSEADWLVGMNATRAVTLWRRGEQDVLCSLGRVQTPTLGLLVGRERAIVEFVPRDYFEVHAALRVAAASEPEGRFTAVFKHEQKRRLATRPLAETIATRDQPLPAVVESVEEKTVREPPPLLFDLGALQQTCNRRFGWSAKRTLGIAQALYEQHKLLTYPRTDSRHLSSDLIPQLPKIFAALAEQPVFAPYLPTLTAAKPPRRVFQDGKVSDHHAIIPTPVAHSPARLAALSGEEAKLLDLVARRFMAAFFPDAEFLQTRVVVRVGADTATSGAAPIATHPGDKPARQRARSRALVPQPDTAAAPAHPALPAAGASAVAPAGASASEALASGVSASGVSVSGVAASGVAASGSAAAGSAEGSADLITLLPPLPDRYHAQGRVRLRPGWQEVAGLGEERASRAPSPRGQEGAEEDDHDDAAQSLPRLQKGQPLRAAYEVKAKKTQPPPRYTEATLLSAMEGAGKQLDDEALQEALKDRGLGTPATRAAVIETLLDRGYVTRQGKQLQPTPLGMDLIARLPVPSLGSAQLTGQWEERLSRMARGQESRASFMADIATYVQEIIAAVKSTPPPVAVALTVPAAVGEPRGRARADRSSRGAGPSVPAKRRGRTRVAGSAPVTRRAAPRTVPAADDKAAADAEPVAKRKTARSTSKRAAPRTSEKSPRPRAPAKEGRAKPAPARARTSRAKAGSAAPAEPPLPARAELYPATGPTWAEPPSRAWQAPTAPASWTDERPPLPTRARAAPPARSEPSAGAGAIHPAPTEPLAVGRPIEPPLGCPRCRAGSLIWGRRAWGCSNFRACPLIIPYEFRGRRLGERDLRNLIERGESLPMLLIDDSPGAREVRARLRLSLSGQPEGFLSMVPVPAS